MKTSNELLAYVPNQLKALRDAIRQISEIDRTLNRLLLYQSEDFKRQIDFLRNGAHASQGLPRVGYDLRWTASRLKVESHVVDPQRPFFCSVVLGRAYQKKVERCFESRVNYCRKHGYNYLHLFELPVHFSRPPPWAKIPLLYHAMNLGYDRLFFLDADALITNSAITLEPFFDRLAKTRKQILIAEGTTGVNTGSFFIQRSLPSMILLDLIWKNESFIHSGLWEQDAVRDLLHRFSLDDIFLFAEKAREFNSFAPDDYHGPIFREKLYDPDLLLWQPGDFIVHLTSCRGEQLQRESEKYASLAV